MPRLKDLTKLLLVLGMIFALFHAQSVFAATGILKQINFQGKVVNKTAGTNIANNSYTFVFSIYSASSGGVAIWTESKSVTVTNGIFQTLLGDTTALPGSLDFNTDNLYLGINFNGDGEMTPRVRLAAVPYAFNASKVAGLTVTDTTGTLTIPNGKTIAFADAFSTSGAFPITLTASATTTLTLPTTGTLATLAGSEILTNKTIGSTGLTFENTESISNGTNGTLTFGRNDAGIVTLTAADNDATAALSILPGGAAQLTLGGASMTGLVVTTDGTGDAEVQLPTGSIGSAELLDDSIVEGDLNAQGVLTDEWCLTYESTSGALFEWQSCGAGGATAWDAIGDAGGNGAIAFGTTEQTMDWSFTTTAHDGMTFNFGNAGGTAGTDNGVVINNIVSTNTTGDLNTETLLLLQQLDTTGTGTTVVDNALKIDVAANSGITDGIEITNSAGNLTNGISIVDTAGGTIDKGIVLSGTFTTAGIDAGNAIITNIGNANTDFTSAGGLNLADALDVATTIQAGSANTVLTLSTGMIDADAVTIASAADARSGTSSGSGLSVYSDGLALLQGCTDTQILKWVESTDTWDCAADSTGGASWTQVTKSANESLTNTTGLQNDDHLLFTTSTNTAYAIEMVLMQASSNTTHDFKYAFTIPTGSTMSIAGENKTNTTATAGCNLVTSGTACAVNNAVATTRLNVTAHGFLITAGTAGNFTLQWAGNATSASNTTTVYKHSLLRYVSLGGADLAEVYYSDDQSIAPGDVVSLDPTQQAFVRKSATRYDKNVIGIVSTKPGLLLGDAGDVLPENLEGKKSVNVALSGRVPLKVSTENGPIRAGDLLTSSSIPGVAMRSVKAGAVIGQALSPFEGTGSGPPEQGQVVAFIKTSYSVGSRASDLIAGLHSDPLYSGIDSSPPDLGKLVLEQFITDKEMLAQNLDLSEIITDRVAAGFEVITPSVKTQTLTVEQILAKDSDITIELDDGGQLLVKSGTSDENYISFDGEGNAYFSGTLTAQRIKATTIEGNELLFGNIATGSGQVAGATTDVGDGEFTVPTKISVSSLFTNSATVSLDLDVEGLLNAKGGLVVVGPAEFKGKTLFQSIVEFASKTVFKGDVKFNGRPVFNRDTAGVAIISKGQDRVDVLFTQPYEREPMVQVSPSFAFDYASANDEQRASQEAVERAFLDGNIQFIVTGKTIRGFTVKLNKSAPENVQFDWSALAVDSNETTVSTQEFPSTTSTTNDVASDPAPSPSAVLTVEPSPTLMMSPSPTPSPSPSTAAESDENAL